MGVDLEKLSDEEILELRIGDLPIAIERGWLEECVRALYQELDEKGIGFKPVCYLADEWLTPDKEPVIGIPFYLADPSLIKLERKMMLEVEGGTTQWCMQLLRHETGHAINYAYKMYRRKKWQEIFGNISVEYDETYRFRPYSKSFVQHLADHYAQCHPEEDFSETFSVWLTPNYDWREKYKGWKALTKLECVDELMSSLKDKEPLVAKGKKYWEARKMRTTLKNYYKKKRRHYAENFPDFHDVQLEKMFEQLHTSEYSDYSGKKRREIPFAAELLRRYRKQIVQSVALCTGERKYGIDELVKKITERCKALKLVLVGTESVAVLKVSTYITTLILNSMYTGKYRGA